MGRLASAAGEACHGRPQKGTYAYSRSGTLCYSALFHAARFDELLAVLALDPKPYWHDQQWTAKALATCGDVDGAVILMEGLRSSHAPDRALSAVAEQLLLDAGRVDEAYARYAIQATSANTHIATYRAIAKRYPGIEPSRILGDLIASVPGEERKWFATAKSSSFRRASRRDFQQITCRRPSRLPTK